MKKIAILSLVAAAVVCWISLRPAARAVSAAAEQEISAPVSVRASAFGLSAASLIDRTPSKMFSGPLSEAAVSSPGVSGADWPSGIAPARETDGSPVQFGGLSMPAPSLSFDGLVNLDNARASGVLIIPPDMNGDVGPNHYVQIVNSLFRVYDKNGGALTPPIKLSDLFAGLNTPCAERNDGLPNVLYDPLADRWMISQVCSLMPPFRQMIAVSKTADPAGQYFLYEFVMPNVKINDFPKFGVWADGYYMTTDEFLGSDYVGNGMFAFDRAKMLAGDPAASYIYFNRPVTDLIRRGGMLPADLDGLRTRPLVGARAPAIFATYTATEYGDPNDAIRLFEFKADFANPQFSTFTERPESPITVAAFDPTSPPGRQDILQPPPGEYLDSISDRLNPRLAYRNFGTYESLTVNQTVRTTPESETYRAGVRVYELRSTGGAYSPAVATTIGDAVASRWIGAVAQDHQGNIAVEYNHVTDVDQPSVFYSGRLTTDPANVFRPEETLIKGTGVQKAFGWRWGEYSGMTVDPIDDCTFWMTNAYYTLESQNISDFTWLTRIGRFKFAECTAAPRANVSGTVTNSATGLPVDGAVVSAYPVTRSTAANGNYGPMQVLPGIFEITASARGYLTASILVSVADGESIDRDFVLTPVAVLENAGFAIVSESCRLDQAPEPGERVTVDVTLRNTGAAATQNLVASIVPILGVTDPSAPQNYGALAPGGQSVTRRFTFTVASGVQCGGEINIVLSLADGLTPLGSVQIVRTVGEPRVAFRENFDGPTAPGLPAGWTTSSTENHQLWRTSSARAESAPNSLFSPAPIQQGVNEVTSPPFHIATADAELSFRNWYELETTFLRNRLYDGSVLEIQIANGAWRDIIDAGGTFLSGGYDGTIDACCQNPLANRQGWSGRSGAGQVSQFITTRAKLPAAAAGQDVRLRFRIGSDIGGFREGQYIDDLVVTDGFRCDCSSATRRGIFDFDGDGKTDLALYNFSDSASFADLRFIPSSGGNERAVFWGSSGDAPAFADYDGDGMTDLAVYRPVEGKWYVLNSSNATVSTARFGLADDRPQPYDFDGDGRADLAVFRPQTATWYIHNSSNDQVSAVNFGLHDDTPVPADYDGDGKADIAVYRQTDGTWYALQSSNGAYFVVPFGLAEDVPVPGDFDGDGKADLAVFRPSSGVWYLNRSQLGFAAARFGVAGDLPLRPDFDGDGKADISVFRPATGVWYYLKSTDLSFAAIRYGEPGERPVPAIY